MQTYVALWLPSKYEPWRDDPEVIGVFFDQVAAQRACQENAERYPGPESKTPLVFEPLPRRVRGGATYFENLAPGHGAEYGEGDYLVLERAVNQARHR